MSHRIKKTTDLDGATIYVPQFKNFGFYWDYWETSFPPHKVFFRSYDMAERFITIQKTKPQDEFFEV
jgi:hypothetical protein